MTVREEFPVLRVGDAHVFHGTADVSYLITRLAEVTVSQGHALMRFAEQRAVHLECLTQEPFCFSELALHPQDDAKVDEALSDECVPVAEDASVERKRLARKRLALVKAAH